MIKYSKMSDIVNNRKEIKNDKYYMSMIKIKWKQVVGEIIAENSFPVFFSNGKLLIDVKDNVLLQELQMHKDVILKNIEIEIGSNIVFEINLRLYKNYYQYVKVKYEEKEEKEIIRKYTDIQISEKDSIISNEEKEKIELEIDKIDIKDNDLKIKERVKKIAIKKKIEEKQLLESGLIYCIECNELFLPKLNEKKCIKCKNKKEEDKLNKVKKIIYVNPLIDIRKASYLAGEEISESIYNRARDIISQDFFYDLIELVNKHKEVLKEDSFYHEKKEEILKEYKDIMDKYVKYKIGTEDEMISNIVKKETIFMIKQTVNRNTYLSRRK